MNFEATDTPPCCGLSLASSGFDFEGQLKEDLLTGGLGLNRSDDSEEK